MKLSIGDKVINKHNGKIGIIVSGKIISHHHILWEDGSRSDLINALEKGYIIKENK